MGYKAAVQVLRQAEDLKFKVLKKSDLLNDTEAWTNQQQLQNIYHQVLVLDLEYALDKKVELDLWNIGFKNHISNLQEMARDKKNSHRSDFQALLTWALESASGFYLTLLQELCNTFDIDLPFRRRGIIYGHSSTNEPLNIPQLASCSYICQYCLVHLGDIARYRNQRRQAENFYRQAILLSPQSGHPYNQLALLEASQGDKLSTVFYYIRGICVKNPFPASGTNLLNVLNSTIDKESPLEKIHTKMNVNEYIQLFLCAHGHFQMMLDSKQAELAVYSLNSVMTALVATQSFTRQELIKITIINLYALTHLGKDQELTKDEHVVKDLILQLIAGSLSAFLMPVYTLQNEEGLLNYYALPAAKLLMGFTKNSPDILKCNVFKERMQIWPSLCKLVNAAQSLLPGFNFNKFSNYSLKEDRELQGFLPLESSFKNINFKLDEVDDKEVEDKIRIRRIIEFANWLCDHDVDGIKLITKTEKKGLITYEAVLSQPDPTKDLLEEMKSFSIKDSISLEKKSGILKPQGSLEKAREEREVKKTTDLHSREGNSDMIRSKRAKQNIVLQNVFKKIEENKQVKFNVEEAQDKEKLLKFDQNPQSKNIQPPVKQPANVYSNPPPRTPTFNQNNAMYVPPAVPQNVSGPPPSHQNQASNDYLTNLRNLGNGADNMMPQFSKNTSYSNVGSGPNSGNQPPNQQALKIPSFAPQFSGGLHSQFNSWNRDDISVPSHSSQNPWWGQNVPNQNYPTPNQSFPNQASNPYGQQRLENHSSLPTYQNQQYQQPNQNYPQRSQDPNFGPMSYSQFNLQYPNQMISPQNNMVGTRNYDVFKSWGPNGGNSFAGEDMSQSSMSMRQAMLKEATLQRGRMPPPQQRMPQTQEILPSNQGYSLFNNMSWAPNLQNQSRNNDNTVFNGPQHSLFGGPGPQSLAQLLEHQQSQMNRNMKNSNHQDT
ncbi:hypothetical protein ABEB36_005592 [Hypothenemus hampei]|uniref:Protein SMG7 n=1 Tax=Hypothenemus hampei TaxID=57062 RepID=A0ABD1EYS5_HYPHA